MARLTEQRLAVGLAVIDQQGGDEKPASDVTDLLAALDAGEVREILTGLAAADPDIRRTIEIRVAAQSGDTETVSAELVDLVTQGLSTRGYVDYRRSFEVAADGQTVLDELADHDGDVDTAVELLSGDEHVQCGAIVQRRRNAGRTDDAVVWIDRGVAAGRLDIHGRENSFWLSYEGIARTYRGLGRIDDAFAVLRNHFARQPGLGTYRTPSSTGRASRRTSSTPTRWSTTRSTRATSSRLTPSSRTDSTGSSRRGDLSSCALPVSTTSSQTA